MKNKPNVLFCKYLLLIVLLQTVFLAKTSVGATRTSVATGNWNNSGTWDCSCTPATTDDVVIVSGTTVNINANYTIANVTINSGGVISHNTGANRTLTITGNYTNNGTQTGGNNADAKALLTGSGTTIDGLGSVSTFNGIEASTGDKTVASTANLTVAATFTITGNITVTNNGIITITSGNNLVGSAAGSTWTNAANSTLKAGGAILATGTFNASASGNTVEYFYEAAQNITTPSGGDYYHLTASSASTKSIQGTLIINGNLNISSGTLDVNGNDFSIKGNWTNAGTFTTGTRTVTFTGSANQTITNTSNETFYNFTLNKADGTITLDDNVTVSNTFTMTAGKISTGGGSK